jgi:membrane-bound serine protease (ClpP class)
MVDESVIVSDLNDDSTKLVTLTAEEAVKYKMADTILSSLQEVKDYFGFSYAETKTISSNWAEDVVRFLSNPIVSSLLIMIGLIGLFTEIKTPGWGVAGTSGIIALALFFGTSYILELATIWEILLFIIGVILLLIEIFVIPGFGITGIVGIILMVAALFFGLITDIDIATTNAISIAIIQLASTFVATAIVIYFIWKLLPKSQTFNKLILNENLPSKSGYAAKPTFEYLVGQTGKALTDLRPSGSAIINDERIDVVTEGDYIERGNEIIVKKVEGSKVVVIKNK